MSTITNFNAMTSGVLTDYGAKVMSRAKGRQYESGETIRMTLWEVMQIFGPHLFVGSEVPFKDNVVHIEELK